MSQKDSYKNENIAESTEKSYRFYWNYRDQTAFEANEKRKAKKRGGAVFAAVMVTAFLIAFVLLVISLVLYVGNSPNVPSAAADYSEAAEAVKQATVLVYASGNSEYGYGSGFFVRADGYIVTNYHVVEGADYLSVVLYTGEEYEAKLVGYRKADDLAVLKISGTQYPTVEIGDSSTLRVGEVTIAVGHPGGTDAAWSVTSGIVSALDREVLVSGEGEVYEVTMIQTDAPVNHGNSGGPLCNSRGEVIGVVTRKMSDNEGIGLALPINGTMEIVNALIQDGNSATIVSSISKTRPTIGIELFDIRKGEAYTYNGKEYSAPADGMIVTSVLEGSGADGKLEVADLIVAIDGVTVRDSQDLKEVLYLHRAGDRVRITVIRNGDRVTVEMILGKT